MLRNSHDRTAEKGLVEIIQHFVDLENVVLTMLDEEFNDDVKLVAVAQCQTSLHQQFFAALESIFDKYGYHVLDKALRILVSTWEGEMYSLSGNTLNAVARLIAAYGDALNEETFKERLGLIPMKTIIRTARERRPGSLGYAEAMLVFYNKKCRYRLSMRKLYGTVSDEEDLEDDDDSENEE